MQVLPELTACAVGCALSICAQAQAVPTSSTDARSDVIAQSSSSLSRSAVGLQWDEGQLWGLGPGYKALFEPDGFTFTPALGSVAPRSYPLRFCLEEVGRGESPERVPPAELATERLTVRYERSGIIERYEVRPDGIEQSFVFHRLPVGTGDLVVRGRIETDLVLAQPGDSREGLAFEARGLGGVRFGGVIGIDAAGARVKGSLRHEGGMLELVLPASFVDRAALPLVLDPLVGTTAVLSNQNDHDPDVAYDATNDVYLVVWERVLSQGDKDVLAHRVDPSGTPVGGLLGIATGSTRDAVPGVANVNLRDRFVVVWTRGQGTQGDLFGRTVDAATGSLGPTAAVAAGGPSLARSYPRLGGEATTLDDDVLCTWWEFGGTIHAVEINVSTTGVVTPLAVVTLATRSAGASNISKSGGASGRHMITWLEDVGGFQYVLRGVVVTRDLVILDLVSITTVPDCISRSSVDGDGKNWVISMTRTPGNSSCFGAGWDTNVYCRVATFDPKTNQTVLSNEITVAGDPDKNERSGSVAFLGGSCLVAYSTESGGGVDTHVKSVDPFSCVACEGAFLLDGSAFPPRIAGQISGDPSGDPNRALLVWERSPTTMSGEIRVRPFRADDGLVTDLGGGCGPAGDVHATCARVGHLDFRIRLRCSAPSTPAYLVISLDRFDLACGSCSLVPNPITGHVVTATTDAHGDASSSLPIPNAPSLVGLTAYLQWLVPQPSPGCSRFGTDLSNALLVQIQ